MTVAADLARFIIDTPVQRLRAETTQRAAMLIASTLASAAMGSEISSVAIARSLLQERGGMAEASVWFAAGPRFPAAEAARVNAMMSDAAAADDSDLRNVVHPGTTLVATALALAEQTGAAGTDVLAAIVLGYEAAGRIGGAITPGFLDRGHHGCVVAIFGAAAAAGRLLRLSVDQMTSALALAATSIGGLMVAANTSTAREYHAGNAALLGIHAALAAKRGYAAEAAIFEAHRGFFEVYGAADRDGVTREFGNEWHMLTNLGIKLMPGGHQFHAVAEACILAAKQGRVTASEVERITVLLPARWVTAGPARVRNLIDAAHSPAYFAAAALVDGDFTWVHASPERILNPAVQQLLAKVVVSRLSRDVDERARMGAAVMLTTRDGRTYSSTIMAPKGSGPRGIAWADIDAKYRALMPIAGVASERMERSLTLIHKFGRTENVPELLALLC